MHSVFPIVWCTVCYFGVKMGCLCVKSAGRCGEPFINYGGRCIDICGLKNTKFIIQSGTHYIEVLGLKQEVSVRRLISRMKPLREECKNGDHYLARFYYVGRGSSVQPPQEVKNFYVIKGKSCVVVKNLSCDNMGNESSETIFDLHPECQSGSFYLGNRAGFYIIRNRDKTYLQVQDMSVHGYEPETATHHKLHESFTNGLYYFATDNYFYVLKEHREFGLVYHRTKDLRSNADVEVSPVSSFIVSIVGSSSLERQANEGI